MNTITQPYPDQRESGLPLSLIDSGESAVKHGADQLSANSFFNAFIRETATGQYVSCMQSRQLLLVVQLTESHRKLYLPLASHCGNSRHQFKLPLFIVEEGGDWQEIALLDAMAELLAEPSYFPDASVGQRAAFLNRCRQSIDNMREVMAHRQDDLDKLFSESINFQQAEQGLLCGHSIHPVPKSREPLSTQEAIHYAPEFAGKFSIIWLAVANECWVGESSEGGSERSSNAQAAVADDFYELWRNDKSTHPATELLDNYSVFPAHPWQWQQLQRHSVINDMLGRGDIYVLGHSSNDWRATSSLRAIYSPDSDYMLKFSLSLRLTNSLRVLLPKEMRRGLEVRRIRNTTVGQEFSRRYPYFQILAEPAYAMLKPKGATEGIPETLVLLRENPFIGSSADNVCLLATLTQDHPYAEECRAARVVRQLAISQKLPLEKAVKTWFQRYLERVVEPLMIAQADYGLLYGAHQQNLIIRFDRLLPSGAYFRDCQGTAYSNLGITLLKPELPELGRASENTLNERMANHLFVYYLFINSSFGLVSALAAYGLCSEKKLFQQMRDFLIALRNGPRQDRSCFDYLLESDQLWSKGNFLCSVVGMNESTTEDPLAIYHPMVNPLKI